MPAYISFDNIFYIVFVVHFHLLLQLLGLSHAQNRTNENFAHMCVSVCVLYRCSCCCCCLCLWIYSHTTLSLNTLNANVTHSGNGKVTVGISNKCGHIQRPATKHSPFPLSFITLSKSLLRPKHWQCNLRSALSRWAFGAGKWNQNELTVAKPRLDWAH